MCLDKVTKLNFDPKKEVTAYKVFLNISDKDLRACYFRKGKFTLNRWINEKDYRFFYVSNDTKIYIEHNNYTVEAYPYGFHAFASQKEAEEYNNFYTDGWAYIVRKVKLRKIVAEGTDSGYNSIVAQEMLIIDKEV